MLEIRLFGTGQARYCEQPLDGFPNQQSCLLLCYLLLNRRYPHYRERLAAVFWGDHPAQNARKYLRNALWRLRQSLHAVGAHPDDYLSIDDDSVSFLVSSNFWLDVEIFEKTTARYQDLPGQDLTTEQTIQLEEALDLYLGDLLESVYEDWCLTDRERLRNLYLNALTKLMAFHGTNGTYERGLACGERILALDKTRENVHRRMMRLHALADDRNAALAQYKLCAQILLEELGIPPAEKTRRLYEQLLKGPFDLASWPVSDDASLPVHLAESAQPLAAHALEKLHQLQQMAEQTSKELRHIERLISRALLRLD